MPFENLCTKSVSANRFAKWTVQSVDANVEKGPAFDTAGNTSKGAVYSQTKTVRHGMRAAIVVVTTVRCGRGRVDSARRGETNACATANAATRMRSAIRAVSTCRVDAMCLMYACGPLRASLHGCCKRSASALRWDCFTRARSAIEGMGHCKRITEAVRTKRARRG